MVRAKFKLNSYTTEMGTKYPKNAAGGVDWSAKGEPVEKRTLNFTPVSSGSPENTPFWDATPSGSLQLGVVNQEAWKEFELGKEYYLDFTPA